MSIWITCQTLEFVLYTVKDEDAEVIDRGMLYSETVTADYLAGDMTGEAWHLSYQAQLGSEAYIKSGDGVSDDDIYSQIYDRFYSNDYYSDSYGTDEDDTSATENTSFPAIYPAVEGSADYMTDETIDNIVAYAKTNDLTDVEDELSAFKVWLKVNRRAYAAVKQEIITEQLDAFRDRSANMPDSSKYEYYAYNANSGTVLTNIEKYKDAKQVNAAKKDLANANVPLMCTQKTNTMEFSGSYLTQGQNTQLSSTVENEDTLSDNDVTIVMLKQSALNHIQKQWTKSRAQLLYLVGAWAIGGVCILICFIILCFGAGRKTTDETIHFTWLEAVWTEIQIIVWSCSLALFVVPFEGMNLLAWQTARLYAFWIVLALQFVLCSLVVLLSQIRRIKSKKWLDGWILYRIICRTGIRAVKWFHQQLHRTPLRRRIILTAAAVTAAYLILSCLFANLALSALLILAVAVGVIYFGIHAAERFETVAQAAHDIRAGELKTKIDIKNGSKEMNALADDLNSISEGLHDAVATAVQSERLKAELISNVSHDIKTPLTGIITYIDLLKKCDLQDETARGYVEVLDKKAQRLKTLTGDLFDASKASSGALPVELGKVDFDALMQQAAGERMEQLQAAGLKLRINSKPELYAKADGRLLWRVLDNLFSNCIRYAQPNSRVYIDLKEDGEHIVFTMKNISAAELNISADELMERFTRGDRSRHTEGSGLGLSIAASLAELMHGRCYVEVDGDLFKAVVCIPKWSV